MKTKTLGRRILAVLLTLSLFLTTAPLTALPVSAAENDDQLIDVEVYLAECLAVSHKVTIPLRFSNAAHNTNFTRRKTCTRPHKSICNR